MKVLIVEDENYAAERLSEQLMRYDETIEIIDVLDTVEDTSSFLKNKGKGIDLTFLDIQLADGKSFEIFQKTKFLQPVIFTTAFDEYAIEAFQLNSIDYLLKPIKYDQLVKAIDKYKKINQPKNLNISESLIQQLLKGKKAYKQRFLVKYGNHIQFKATEDIALIRADDRLCHIVEFKTARQYLIDHTLEQLDNELLNPDKFFRINRKFIVNIDAIKDIRCLTDQRIEIFLNIPCKEKLTVSRSRFTKFKSWIDG